MFAAFQGLLALLGLVPKFIGLLSNWLHDRGIRKQMTHDADQDRQVRGANVRAEMAKIDTETEKRLGAIHTDSTTEKVTRLRDRFSRDTL